MTDPGMFFDSMATGPWAAAEDPTNRLARALVRIGDHALDIATPLAEIDALVDRLEAIASSVGGASIASSVDGAAGPATRYRPEDRADGLRVQPNATGTHPLCGPANPVAPPIVLRRDGATAIGEVIYDLRFEGLPGLVQGGFVAAAFDLVIGQAVGLAGTGGMTGTLSVRYVSPTPLYQPLRYTSWFERRDGRKCYGRGELVVAGTGRVCAEAEAVFIAPRRAATRPAPAETELS